MTVYFLIRELINLCKVIYLKKNCILAFNELPTYRNVLISSPVS